MEKLTLYGMHRRLLNSVKHFHNGHTTCVRVNRGMSEWSEIHKTVHQSCVMSPLLFNVFMDGVLHEMKARLDDSGELLNHGETM